MLTRFPVNLSHTRYRVARTCRANLSSFYKRVNGLPMNFFLRFRCRVIAQHYQRRLFLRYVRFCNSFHRVRIFLLTFSKKPIYVVRFAIVWVIFVSEKWHFWSLVFSWFYRRTCRQNAPVSGSAEKCNAQNSVPDISYDDHTFWVC